LSKRTRSIDALIQRSLAAATHTYSILDSQRTVGDAPNAAVLTSSEGRIDFENVMFRYAGTVINAVSNINLRVEPGKTYALVGASGAGKSTILSLILRLYDVVSGAEKIDD